MAKSNRLRVAAKCGLFTAVILWTGCGGTGHSAVEPTSDLDLRIERLDQDLFRSAGDTAFNFSLKLYATYGPFYRDYVERILGVGRVDDPRLPIALTAFVMNPDWRAVQQRADSVLGDLEPQRAEMEAAFERLHTLFPDSTVPRVIAFNSGYNYGIVPTDSVLGIGVEWFVTKGSPLEALLAPEVFPQYLKDRMRPEMLVPSAVKGWLQVHYTRDVAGEDVLTHLVEIGKVMHLLESLLPGTNPALCFAFTDPQLTWCESNEFNIWKQLVTDELLYSRKPEDVDRLMNDAPFTNGFPRESPGHIGEWIGYRMVAAYMKGHPDVTIPQLLASTDPRVVLKSYKPR
jgi:hypothetical protein